MTDSGLEYTVEAGGFIDRWLLSDVIAEPLALTMQPDSFPGYHPGASVKDKDGRERKSPAKQEYLRLGEFKKLEYPSDVVTERLYYPADTTRVDCSRVFKFPADARFFARAYVECDADVAIKACMYAVGGMKLWINGRLCSEYFPYESNIETGCETTLTFTRGKNELLAAVNDYGERNIMFRFGLQILEGELKVSLPVDADVDRISRMRGTLSGLYTDRLSYRSGAVMLCSEKEFPESFEFTVEAEDTGRYVCTAKKGDKTVVLFDAGDVPSGYHEFTLKTTVEGVELDSAFCLQICPGEREKASLSCSTYDERRRFCLEYGAGAGDGLDNYIASLASGNDEFERFRASVLGDLEFAERRGDCADFRVQRFIWLLGRFKNRIDPELKTRIEELILGFRYWFDEPGNDAMWFFSENHALAFHSDEYLAGSMFPDSVFDNSGLTGLEHMAKAKIRIVEWFEKLLRSGYNEWNSSTYVNVDVFTYITLYEFAGDEEIRTLARRALDMTFEMYACNSLKGVMGTSNGRTYDKDILGNECMSGNSQMWLAWGVGCINRRISPAIYIAMSDYVPSAELKKIASCDFDGRFVREKKEGTMEVETYLCKTKRYILGTCRSPRTGGPGSQELLMSMFLMDAGTRIFINLPGESKMFGIRRPGYFSGNALTPLVTQNQNVAVMSYRFPKLLLERSEVGFIHIMCDEQECDEVILKDNALFIRRGEAFAAIICSGRLRRTDRAGLAGREFVFDGINSEWLVKASDITEFESFKDFVDYHMSHLPCVEGRELCFTDKEFGILRFPLLTEDYLLREVGPEKLISLGIPKKLIESFRAAMCADLPKR